MVLNNILSIFDGISCGQLALKKAGIGYINYYASEIDKYAVQITQKNFPDTIQLGDCKYIEGKKEFRIDLLLGGSPCQSFSFAGKQLNFNDPRGKLFFEFARIKNEFLPKWFLFENVKMKKEYINIITNYLGVEPVLINSDIFVCQNRERLYWTNIPIIELPKRPCWNNEYYQYRKIYFRKNKSGICPSLTTNIGTGGHNVPLQKIVESGIVDRDTSFCIDANYYKGGNIKLYYDKSRRQLVFDNNKYRKLTPVECERLQTIPDNYTQGISNSQRYKVIGNSWTVDVIAHILKGIYNKLNI